ncbi:MAG: aminopeptidase P family N-terminal domain-containing protein [Bacteroidales bacterium]|jgi:Xaa-Pro aminopeptidase|nr:aminopeptidase P family N-terminal domain-containing protein [Bacteroidales bacterium]MDD2263773.1 aminopeptidase P family N-terminal domain-containing protein [Bacteroidales bacterium]MDD2831009.1 aminopeptidase P family N-terminal domain-containing protein [Bacteroidales bacterium]MDD3208183.1 aminopeptidase P family N-terminal domain-containing protein [Bacteroidales bacterium]MDD3696775.1 aminopeptidase P family N-terminal domain-containing protein [Bacteroidales bacterium]
MNISDKIQALRLLMQEAGWDAAVISGTDPHGSEYLPERWQQRKWISGFTGSFGTVVITLTHAGLWTDTRYFIQSRRELEGTEFELHPLRVPNAVNYPEWLAANLTPGAVVGFDGECVTYREAEHLKQALKALNATIDNRPSFLDAIWNDRPELPLNSVFILEKKYSGKDTREKLERLRRQIEEQSCTHMLLSSLDQIAWLFNIRCHDIPYNPVAISYALVDEKNATLFITPGKISDNVNKILHAQGVSVMPYDSIPGVLQSLPAQTKIMADGDTLNYSAFQNLLINCTVYDVQSPVILDKAIKNSVETEGFRKAFLYDGLAMERFFFWLERTLENDVPLTEIDAGKKLSWMRTLSQDAMGDSFGYISAYGANAALPHYNAVVGACSRLEKKGLYLIDSGSHYLYGTTDITRTVPLGPLSLLEKEDYTIALKGMIALSRAVFLKGTTGTHLDMLAKDPLWRHRRNYGHGTGHGIGHYLCVHEGPQDIRMNWKDQAILPGMVTSNEPGIYREGSHGVRHENILLCRELDINESGTWLGFETLTVCHIETSPVITSLMDRSEIEWLNDYNQSVYSKLAPFLTYEESSWLKNKTAPLIP